MREWKGMIWNHKENGIVYLHCINTAYAPEIDMTFVLEDIYINNEALDNPLVSTECISWSYGNLETLDEIKDCYCNGNLKAEYQM